MADFLCGNPIGAKDVSGALIKCGDRVKVINRNSAPIADGWGDGDFGTYTQDDKYEGTVFYNPGRCEFRIDDQPIQD